MSDHPARFLHDGVKFILPKDAVSINRRLFGWTEKRGGETLRHAERNANPFCFLKNNNKKKITGNANSADVGAKDLTAQLRGLSFILS